MKHQIEEIEKNILFYETAKKQLETYINTINNEFEVLEDYNPINYIKTRVKTVESIIGKLKRKKLPISKEGVAKLNDIVGARIIVDFIENIYELVEKIKQNGNITVIKEKDYVKNPKESGYRGYHIIVSIPISIRGTNKNINCEIQIRTTAMDFWATNEHKLNYKSKSHTKKYQEKWIAAAGKVWDLDTTMNELYLEGKQKQNNLAREYIEDLSKSALKSLDMLNKLKKLSENYG